MKSILIKGKNINKPIVFDEKSIRSALKIEKNIYPLDETEFDILTSKTTDLKLWSLQFLFISIGAFIIIISKFIAFYIQFYKQILQTTQNLPKEPVNQHELWMFFIPLIISGILFGVSFFINTEKSKKQIEIKNYFQ